MESRGTRRGWTSGRGEGGGILQSLTNRFKLPYLLPKLILSLHLGQSVHTCRLLKGSNPSQVIFICYELPHFTSIDEATGGMSLLQGVLDAEEGSGIV